jgi:hypothetical protein
VAIGFLTICNTARLSQSAVCQTAPLGDGPPLAAGAPLEPHLADISVDIGTYQVRGNQAKSLATGKFGALSAGNQAFLKSNYFPEEVSEEEKGTTNSTNRRAEVLLLIRVILG